MQNKLISMENSAQITKSISLEKYGIINAHDVVYNPSFDLLYHDELNPALEGFEKGQLTELGAVNVMTGVFTGRSPKDKYIVKDDVSKDTFWWTSEKAVNDNKPISQTTWNALKENTVSQLSGKKLYVVDAFCGANENTRLKVRFIMEVAWQAHFVKNMFIRPTEEELDNFGEPDFIVMNASKKGFKDFADHGLNSEVYVAFNLTEKIQLIGGTWYGGEMKKGLFSMMNYYLPLQGIASMHCSANKGAAGDVAVFFGLSGTGKTTLSTDPKRELIGDDEHGWDNDGVFNFEGGCYAKCIDLTQEKEPQIWEAIKHGALVENITFYPGTRTIDFTDKSLTENTRVAYPIHFIPGAVVPSMGSIPKNIFFLTCDASGVLPPISKLNAGQAKYQFISGYTAKVAGTEKGVTEPQKTFSTCFGAPFLPLHPAKYANLLGKKIRQYRTNVWLINTGWTGGAYGVGSRMKLSYTRAMITAALAGKLSKVDFEEFPIFGFNIPTEVPGVPSEVLNPRNTWANKAEYDTKLNDLATAFLKNFQQFEAIADEETRNAAPKTK